jgi:hypothetical protein
MRSKNKASRLLTALAAVALVGMLTIGTTTAASAGGGVATAAKKKKKRCPAGTVKKVVKKHGKKKKKCVPIPAPPAPPAAALTINPASFAFPDTQHGGLPCPACPTQAFTVTNSGGASSGALTTSITDVADPVALDDPAFTTTTNTCAGALPPGATCSVTVIFAPSSNGGDGNYVSLLKVTGAPGGAVQATLSGHAD